MKEPVGVSLCLLGIPCRYNGKSKRMKGLERFLERFSPVPFCPEQLAGMPTPRPPAQFFGGDGRALLLGKAELINEAGENVSQLYVKGCQQALLLIELLGLKKLFLKEKSPCCGVNRVWVEGDIVEGSGILKALIEQKGLDIHVLAGDEFSEGEGYS
jgi:uncharacterized protein YbbK (DUF523 family)